MDVSHQRTFEYPNATEPSEILMRSFTLATLLILSACAKATPEAFSDCRTSDGDAFEFDSSTVQPRIEGDTLYFTVGYGGGCETHEWQICWPDPSFAESMPVQASLEVWHNANGDSCEAYEIDELSFDLTPLKEAYIESYGGDSGEISVNVAETSVIYSF